MREQRIKRKGRDEEGKPGKMRIVIHETDIITQKQGKEVNRGESRKQVEEKRRKWERTGERHRRGRKRVRAF